MSKEKTKAELVKEYEGRIAQLTTANKGLDKQIDHERAKHATEMNGMRLSLGQTKDALIRVGNERNQFQSDNEGLVRIIKAKQGEIDELTHDTTVLEHQAAFNANAANRMLEDRDKLISQRNDHIGHLNDQIDLLMTVIKNEGISDLIMTRTEGKLVVAYTPTSSGARRVRAEDPREDFFEWKRRRTVRGWEITAVCDACGLC